MSRKQGKASRMIGRLFKERQIYHRSDGIVRFIKLSTQTQIALASIGIFALCWIAYASVNVVFKEQIINSKDRDHRNMVDEYRARMDKAERAYNDVNSLNVIFAEEYASLTTRMENRLEALTTIVQHKGEIDDDFDRLAETLASAGAPNGKPLKNANRIMVDPVGKEPTPRQSRESRIRDAALDEITSQEVTAGLEHEMLKDMRHKSAEITARQMILLASIEADIRREIAEKEAILTHTGVDTSVALAKTRILYAEAQADQPLTTLASFSPFTGQGGPDTTIDGTAVSSADYYKAVRRVEASVEELTIISQLMKSVPLSMPISAPHRMTSRFGVRRDPFSRKRMQSHDGLDFAGGWNSPILATAPGRVSFAGIRGGYGRTVEIDHGNGFKTRYAHMNKIKVRAGQKVGLQETVGLLGSSGRSTGPHVHWEVLYNGRHVDPLNFVEAGRYVFES